MLIDGRKLAKEVLEELGQKPKPEKFLAAFLIGDDPSSLSFINQKKKTAEGLGLNFRLYQYPAEIKNDELRKEILKTTQHKTCGGALIQLPLPPHLNQHYILNVIPREKDVDVLGERALGAFYTNRNPIVPPAVGTVEKILQNQNRTNLKGKRTAVVGLGLLIGRPISVWLMRHSSEPHLFKSGSDLSSLKEADVVITGTGQPGLIKPDMLKGDALVIDFGYARGDKGQVVGDFDPSSLKADSSIAYTPTPGGTGPILVTQLFKNFYTLNEE